MWLGGLRLASLVCRRSRGLSSALQEEERRAEERCTGSQSSLDLSPQLTFIYVGPMIKSPGALSAWYSQ